MTQIQRIDADFFRFLSALIRLIRVIRVPLIHSLLRTPIG